MVPYFWSDQYGKKIQMLGHARPMTTWCVSAVVRKREVARALLRGGVVTGIVTLSQPRA